MSFPSIPRPPAMRGTAALATLAIIFILILSFALGAFSPFYASSQTNSTVGIPAKLNVSSTYRAGDPNGCSDAGACGRGQFGLLDIVGSGIIIGLLLFGIGGFVVIKRRRMR